MNNTTPGLKRERSETSDMNNTTPGPKRERSEPSEEVETSSTSKRAMRRRVCETCCNEKAINQFPSTRRVSTHDHNNDNCKTCCRDHVHNEISNRLDGQVACIQCPELLKPGEIKVLVQGSTFERYERASIRAALATDEEFVHCLSPTCNSGQLHIGGSDNPIFRCQACEYKHCLQCECPWHENESCAERQDRVRLEEEERAANEQDEARRRGEEEEAAAVIEETSKSCPGCRARIEKNMGCDHMTCIQCRYEFCWLCAANYTNIRREGNHRHERACLYYFALPSNVDGAADPRPLAAPASAGPAIHARIPATRGITRQTYRPALPRVMNSMAERLRTVLLPGAPTHLPTN